MPELVPFPLNGSREPKATGRELAQVERARRVGLAVIDQVADHQTARVDAVAYVGVRAMNRAAQVVEIASQLSTLVPEAAQQLQGLANVVALGMAEVVSDTARRVR